MPTAIPQTAEIKWCWRREISGALGDIGIFFPIAVALITLNGMSATAVLLAAGLFYMATALYFRLPMPVQPLKALAVIAIATHATPSLVAGAGLVIGVIFLLLSITGGLQYLASIFPRALVRGIQLGIGCILIRSGIGLMQARQLVPAVPDFIGGQWGPLSWGLWVGIAVALLLLLYGNHQSFPVTPLVILFGLMTGWFLSIQSGGFAFKWGPSELFPAWPSGKELLSGFLLLALPQIPLSFGNAMVGTTSAARTYFGARAARVNTRSLGIAYGAANILSALMGGMPMCQGAGGLTAHVRFGAQTARATLLTGGLFVALALVTGRSAPVLLGLIPSPLLGAMLAVVGWDHCQLIRDVLRSPMQMIVVVVVAGISLFTGNLLYALLAGCAAAALLWALRRGTPWREVFGPLEQS
jgi:sulfate permease, SulP family